MVALGCALVASCVVRVDYGGTAFSCAESGECPDGFSCENDVCVELADGGGAGNFAFTRTLTFDNAARGELSDFVVLVSVDASRIDYSAMQVDGSDIQFRDDDGAVIPHEIEEWNPSGTSFLWVRVPLIDAGSTTDFISMDYGDPAAVDMQDAAGVWTDYQAVYHLRDDLADSTRQGFDGANVGSTAIAGIIGPARSFNGVDQYIDLGTDRPFAQNVAGFTVNVWVNPDAALAQNLVAFASSIDGMGAATSTSRIQIIVEADLDVEGLARTEDGATAFTVATVDTPITAGAWTLATLVADFPADTLTLYLDGIEAAGGAMLGMLPASADSLSTQTAIGVDDDLLGNEFLGAIDAVQLRLDAQNADWVSAQHASMTDALISFGAEQPSL